MDSKLDVLINRYNPRSLIEKKNAIKEIMQEIVLLGLSKAGFFNDAAFYGGSALRIFYGLDRFSEDLDFSLYVSNFDFKLDDYIPTVLNVAKKYGLNVIAYEKEKIQETDIKSAFLKGNTIEHLVMFFGSNNIKSINHNEMIKVKFEVDTTPPIGAVYETKYRLLPDPYVISVFSKESLFSGKIHAIVCRCWKNRVKGRDLYDYVFLLKQGIKFNLNHLEARFKDSGFINEDEKLTLLKVKNILISKFNIIDFNDAKEDVLPFISDSSMLDIWSKDFFVSITDLLECI